MMRWHLICACSRFSPPFTYSLMGSLNGQGYNNDNDNNNRLTISLFRYMVSCSGSWRRFNDGQNRGRRRSLCFTSSFSILGDSFSDRQDQDGPSSLQAPAIAQRQTSHGREADWFSVEPTHKHTILVIYHAAE